MYTPPQVSPQAQGGVEMGDPHPLSRDHQLKVLEVFFHNSRHHIGGVNISRKLLLDVFGQISLDRFSNGEEVGQNFDQYELVPNQCPCFGKLLYVFGGGMDDAGGATSEVAKNSGGGSYSIAVPFRT